MKQVIDLRSDTVTKPSKGMMQAIMNAEVGDDVYKEDPCVNRLESYSAELLGKEAALFTPSGVMANQLCLNALTSPGDEVICERDAHIFHFESGSPAALSGLSLNLIDGQNGIMTPEQIEPIIRPRSAYYMARTKVLEIENTHNMAGGIIQPIGVIKNIQELTDKHSLFLHLDGARLWNASVETKIAPAEYSSYFDTVSCCLSKGLGAPVGSVIAGSKDFIEEAFRIRKAWGGGMRQVGILAAAGLYALKNNINRLVEDNQKARDLASYLAKFSSIEINPELVQTNILMFRPLEKSVEQIIEEAKLKNVLVSTGSVGVIRIVFHMDISEEQLKTTKDVLTQILE